VMTRQDRIDYHEVGINRSRVGPYVDRLLAAEALVFSFPVWNMGFPAILKGFVDKVFLPGVSFKLEPNGDYRSTLHNVKRIGVACTYGGARLHTFLMGTRAKVPHTLDATHLRAGHALRLRRALRHEPHHAERRAAFLKEVEAKFSQW